MDWRIVASTFALIFLAELGDKTQLAAMAAATTGERATWSVFLGASVALVLSTLVAVLCGEALTRVVPESTIKIIAGLLFLCFGGWILWSALREKAAGPQAAAPAVHAEGVVARVALRAALAFEEEAFERYREEVATAAAGPVRQVCAWLVEEEERHLEQLRHLLDAHGDAPLAVVPAAAPPAFPAAGVGGAAEALRAAAAHERAAAAFFQTLAEATALPAVREVLLPLAADEAAHAAALDALAGRA